MADKHFLVQGATCICKFGKTPDKLVVDTNSKDYINDKDGSQKKIASTKDTGVPFENKTFGSCAKKNNSPCVPSVSKWSNEYQNITLSNGGKILTQDSKAECAIGGPDCITIQNHGQKATVSEAHFDQIQPEVLAIVNPMASPTQKKKKPLPQVENIKLTGTHVPTTLHSKDNKTEVGKLQAGIDESLTFEVEKFVNGTNGNRNKTAWKVISDNNETLFENQGITFKVNFDALGTYRVIAIGSEGDAAEIMRTLDVEVVPNSINDINIADEPHHAIVEGSGESRIIKLRQGIPATIKAGYLYTPVKDEDRSRVSISIKDIAGNEVAHSATDTVVFTPQNTAAEYIVVCTMQPAVEGQPATILTRKIKTKTNGVLSIDFVDKPEKIRPGTSLKFTVKRMEFSTLVDTASFELGAVKWQLNGVEVGRGGTLMLDGKNINKGDYVVEAFVNVADAYNINKKIINKISEHGDAVKFSVKENHILRIEGPAKMIVGKEYSYKAISYIGAYDANADGPIYWNPRDVHPETILICENVYATGAGNVKVIARMGNTAPVTLECKAAPGQINRWCFTGADNECKTKAGWKETINAVIWCPGAAGSSVEVHLLEKNGSITRDITKIRAVKFDDKDVAKFTFKMADVKEKAKDITKMKDGKYKLFFGIPKAKDGIQFDGVKVEKAGAAEFYIPAVESRLKGNEKDVRMEVDDIPEILSVQFTDSKGEPANKVYNYGEKIKVTIKSKNMAGENLLLHFMEVTQMNAVIRIENGDKTLKVNAGEITTFVLDTTSSYIKAQGRFMEMARRSFYYMILSKEKGLLFPMASYSNPLMANITNAAALQQIHLSGNADAWNNMQNSAGLVVMGSEGEVKGGCGGKYCIKIGDKSELIREINIRLAGFGGCTPDEEFTIKSQSSLLQFQRDYMGMKGSGKICGNTLKAIDEFSNKYFENIADYKCPCQNSNNSQENDKAKKENRCPDGWGKGLYKDEYMDTEISEPHRKYEYPGIHRCTLWAVSAMKFYLDFTKSEFKKIAINRGYRCWADNNFHGRRSTNHLGKAADVWFTKNGTRTQSADDMNKIRKDIFMKYLNAKWWGNPNFFTLEKQSDGAVTYVHVDCRDFSIQYMNDNFFANTQDKVIGKSIVSLARESGYQNTCSCIGGESTIVKLVEDQCASCHELTKGYKGKERELFYKSFGTNAINFIESKGKGTNKFKALYFLAQRRQENSFKIGTPGNNPMNIKGKGNAGQINLGTHETLDGKYQSLSDNFAKFTDEDAGFQGYMDLLSKNFPDAHEAVFNSSKSIVDFVNGLEDSGKKGSYATGQPMNGMSGTQQYKKAVIDNFNSTLSDYKKWYQCKLTCPSNVSQKVAIEVDIKLLNELK